MKTAVLLPVSFAITFFATSIAMPQPAFNGPLGHTAQDPSCAVRFNSMSVHNNRIDFNFANNSARTIQNIEFGAARYDSEQQPHRIQIDGNVDRRLRSGQNVSYDLNIKSWEGSNYAAWMLWPSKIVFTDGTSWQMDNEHASCDVEQWLQQPLRPSASPLDVQAQVPELSASN